MTEADRTVATLAAVFASDRAAAMLARLAIPVAAEASTHAARLAASSRRERLEALSAVLAPDPAAVRARVDAVAPLERSRVASLMRALAVGPWATGAASPLVLRLCRERMGR